MAKSRIVVGTFIHSFRWGLQIRGDERGYVEKVKAYAKLGVSFFTLEREPSLQDSMGIRVYTSVRVGFRETPTNIRQLLLLSLYAIKAGVRRYPSRPIAVYAYNQDLENLWVGYLLRLALHAPLVVVYHHIRSASFSTFGAGVADRMRRGFNPLSAISKSVLPAANLYAARRADVSIALTAATKDEVIRFVGVKECAVVGNGLDSEKFHPLDIPKEYDAVFLGRLAPQKGVDILLKAWKDVALRYPHSRLLLLGGGNEDHIRAYRKLSADLGVEANVTFAGFVSDEDIIRYMGASKVFVFPSRKEGFAQAVSQAMGCGMCCVLSDIPPLREAYGSAASFVPVDDHTALAERIVHFLDAPDERLDFGRRARHLAETFSWEDTAEKELRLLENRRIRAS